MTLFILPFNLRFFIHGLANLILYFGYLENLSRFNLLCNFCILFVLCGKIRPVIKDLSIEHIMEARDSMSSINLTGYEKLIPCEKIVKYSAIKENYKVPEKPMHNEITDIPPPPVHDLYHYTVLGNNSHPFKPYGPALTFQAWNHRYENILPGDCDCALNGHRAHNNFKLSSILNCPKNKGWIIASGLFLEQLVDHFKNAIINHDYESYLSRVRPLSKQQLYRDAIDKWRSGKRQLIVAQGKTDETIYPKIFVSNGITYHWLKMRIFYAFPPALNTMYRIYAEVLEKYWKQEKLILETKSSPRSLKVTNACGMAPQEISTWVNNALISIFDELLICGDDSIMTLFFNGKTYILQLDYKSYDRSITLHAQELFFTFMKRVGFPQEFVDAYYQVIFDTVVLKCGKQARKVKMHHFGQPSGDFKTNFTDGIVNVFILATLRERLLSGELDPTGDDVPNFIQNTFGIQASMFDMTDDVTEATFLKGTFYLTNSDDYGWAPLVTQILNKASTSKRSPEWFAREYAKAKGIPKDTVDPVAITARTLSYYCGRDIPNIPIIKEHLENLRSYWDQDEEDTIFEDLYLRSENPYVDRWQTDDFNYEMGEMLISQRYSVPICKVRELSNLLKEQRPGEYLVSDTAVLFTLYDHIL